MDWLRLSNFARELVAWMADASVRAVVLAALAVLLIPFLRRNSTAQHTAWTLVLAGMLLVPFLRPVVPVSHVHVPQLLAPQRAPARVPGPSHGAAQISSAPTKTDPPRLPLWPLFAVAAYLAGLLLFGARLLGGVLLTRRALRNTRTIHAELWEHFDLIANAKVDLNLEESDDVRVPLTTGSNLMRVIFPADWRTWPTEKRTAVLAHELAHARRRDPLIALVVAVNKCLFWFHPLAWWLERRLPILAEHAADDAALAVSFDTQAYARLLLDGAARLDKGGNRLIWHSAAIGGPVVAQRIRRVLDVRTVERLKPLGKFGSAVLMFLGATLIWISTTVNVPRLVAGQTKPSGTDPMAWQITAEQAAALEQELAADPEDEATRGKLLQYYRFSEMCAGAARLGLHLSSECGDRSVQQAPDRRIALILWLIDHHPESDLQRMAWISPQLDGPNEYEDARNRWLTQVNQHPNDARVLLNAANFLHYDSVREQMDLIKRAQKLDAARGTEALARFYSMTLVSVNDPATRTGYNDPGLAAQIRSELETSNDIALVGAVAKQVVEGATGAALNHTWDFTDLRILATELVTHAQALEPESREWADLMEGVKELPPGSPPAVAQEAPSKVQTIRVAGTVAVANLQESSPPIYPPEAKALGIKGTVKLQIRIGADGHVKETTVISGPQPLTNAAMDAALRYVYKPTMLNGQAAEVLTDIEIAFRPTE
jgi:TonB family protein